MKLTIEHAAWTPRTEHLIGLGLATASIADMKRQTEAGAQLFAVLDEQGKQVAAFLLRVDREAARTVGVVVSAGGALDGVDLTALCLPQIEKMFYGMDVIRMHTERHGLVRKLARQGYATSEIILEKRLHHGRQIG